MKHAKKRIGYINRGTTKGRGMKKRICIYYDKRVREGLI